MLPRRRWRLGNFQLLSCDYMKTLYLSANKERQKRTNAHKINKGKCSQKRTHTINLVPLKNQKRQNDGLAVFMSNLSSLSPNCSVGVFAILHFYIMMILLLVYNTNTQENKTNAKHHVRF